MRMIMVSILVDTREQTLYQKLKDGPFQIEQRALEIGDIHIVKDDIYLIIERKTFADFAASLKDGRYREQKYRLKASGAPVAYILEEVPNIPDLAKITKTIYSLQPSAFISSIIHTSFRDGFHMFFSTDMDETVVWLLEIAKRMEKDVSNFTRQEGGDYIDTVRPKQRKIEQMDVKTAQSMMLMQIPGISSALAKALIEEFGTVRQMIERLILLNETERLESLQKVPLIGSKKAKKIIEYLI